MKKLFFAVVAMAAMLTSCSKDDAIIGVSKSKVTFTINSPELTTRYGEGENATNLYYAVYDAVEGGLVAGLSKIQAPEDITGGKAEVILNLVEGRTYDIIFYAENENSPYYVDWANQTLEVETPTALKSNMEEYDAFYAHVDKLTVGKDKIEETVYLKRPFAQLNILTNDKALGEAAGIEVTTTSVTVNKVYTKMNLMSDLVDTASEAEVTYDMNEAPMREVEVNGTKYHWLSMNYLLVNDKKTVDVTFTMQDKDYKEGDGKLVRTYPAIFVERNHRTNIYGSIITNPAKFNVEILPGFEDYDHNYEADKITEVTVEDGNLQVALDKVGTGKYSEPGTYVFKLNEEMTGVMRSGSTPSYIVKQQEGYNIIIDGCGLKFDGQFMVYGNSRNNGAETLLFRNINFVHTDGKFDFIWSDDGGDNEKRYPHNVTVENCTFTGNADGGAVVGMRLRQVYNANIVNCVSGEGMFSLAQITSSQAALSFDNVTITNNTEGINLLSSLAQTTIKNSNISAGEYGVRADGTCTDATIAIENTNIKALYPVVVRKMTGKLGVVLNGQNTLEAGQQYDVVFTNGAYKSLEEPTGNWSITGAENYNVYPRDIIVGTAEEFEAALKNLNNFNAIIKFNNDITITKEWDARNTGAKISVPVTIDGNGYTIKFTNTVYDGGNFMAAFRFENDANVYNLTFDLSEAKSGFATRVRAISAKANLNVDGCTFIGNGADNNTRAIIFGESAGNAINQFNISVTNSNFRNWKRGVSDNENAQDVKSVFLEANKFENSGVAISALSDITFVNNIMVGAGVSINSYTSSATAKVKAIGNTLDTTQNNVIGAPSRKFKSENVSVQSGFTVYTE